MNALRIGLLACVLVGCRVDGHYVSPEAHTLTVQLGGRGAGVVSSDPEGLTCSEGTCSGEFFEGTVVQLSASAATGSFLGWTEACRGQAACAITMDRDHVVGVLFGNPGETLWLKQLGSKENDSGQQIVIDNDGNVIATGEFHRTIMAGSELTSDGEQDIYVVKLSGSTGSVIWARRFGGTLNDYTFGLAVDESNNIYIGGTFAGTVDFGGGPLTSVGPADTFVLKLDASGGFAWVQTFEVGAGATGATAIAARGNAVVVAGGYGTITVDTTTLTSVGAEDIFVLNLEASTGSLLWIKSFGGMLSDGAKGVALDDSSNVVITGSFSGTVDYGGGTLTTGGIEGYLLKLDGTNGVHLLSREFNSRAAFGLAIDVDSANNIFVSGYFSEVADFGCTNRPNTSVDSLGIFLVKYTQAGSCVWTKGFELQPTNAFAIAVNRFGDVAVTGAFNGSVSFGGDTLLSASASEPDLFTSRFVGDGMHLSSARSGGTSRDEGVGIAQSSDGRIFVTGNFAGFAEFGGSTLNAVGGDDAFIAAFPPL